jgi:predicted nuclease of predicted toxin-antitoxin system
VAHLGLSETADQAIWQYAFNHDYVVVTTNAQDFLHLLNVELHPGLIVLRESGLTNVIRDRLPANSTAPKRSIAVDMMDNASALPTCPQRQHQKQ